MTKKHLSTLLLTVLIYGAVSAQTDEYGKFIQAILQGDTALAMKIEKRNVSVEPMEERTLPVRNIAEHVFPFSIKQLRDTIAAVFSIQNQYDNRFLKPIFYNYMGNDTSEEKRRQIIFNAETKKKAMFGEKYFAKPNTTNDIYIHAFGETWFSRFYFSNGKPLETRTAFIVKLVPQGGEATKVTVVAEHPTVLNGIVGFGVHAPIARETEVQPSSIEEYSLLLFIADKLGDKSLASLKIPNSK